MQARCQRGAGAQSSASCAGLMLPPLQMSATLRPANRWGECRTAATAPAQRRPELHEVAGLLDHPDRDHDHLDVRPGLEDLQGAGGHARDELRLVPGVDVPVTVLGLKLLAVLAGLVEVAAEEDHLGAQGPHRFDLHRVGPLGHADHRPHPEQVRRVGNRLAVVAGRGGDDTPAPLVHARTCERPVVRTRCSPASHPLRPPSPSSAACMRPSRSGHGRAAAAPAS